MSKCPSEVTDKAQHLFLRDAGGVKTPWGQPGKGAGRLIWRLLIHGRALFQAGEMYPGRLV